VKGGTYLEIVKIGRTELQDSVPMTVGQEFHAFAASLDDERRWRRTVKMFRKSLRKHSSNTIEAEQSSEPPQWRLACWNEYQGPYFTMRAGAGLLLEVVGFDQDESSKKQIEMHPDQRLRYTPMVNWHLSDNVRLEMAYGYGHLNRFDLKGNTHFFQSRIQLQL